MTRYSIIIDRYGNGYRVTDGVWTSQDYPTRAAARRAMTSACWGKWVAA